MKKFRWIVWGLVLVLALAACGTEQEETVVKIGVSEKPHKDIVDQVVEDLEKEGIKLEITVYSDYIVPNLALDQGDIDINYFQHRPYLESFSVERNLNLEELGGVHIEPMGVYSKEYDSLDAIPDGSEIYFPNDPTNGGRALLLLEKQGLITLAPNAGVNATEQDILENSKALTFTPLEAAIIPTLYEDVAAAVINGNYAIEHGLNPVNDSIAIEDAESPYVNILAVREGDAENETYKKVLDAIRSDKVKQYIEQEYDGAVVPAF